MSRRVSIALWAGFAAVILVAACLLLGERHEDRVPSEAATRSAASEPVRPSAPPPKPPDPEERPDPGEPQRPEAPVAAERRWFTGRVEDPSGTPIAAAEVVVEAEWHMVTLMRESAITSAEGTYAVDLDALAALGFGAPEAVEFLASARAPLHLSARGVPVGTADLPLAESLSASKPIVLSPGGAVRGRVVDRGGVAVAEADVALGVPDGETLERTRTDALGRFELPIPIRGTGGVRAEKSGFGAAVASPIALAPGEDVLLADLVLAGDGRIAGIAVYPDGAPVPDLALAARHDSSIPPESREMRRPPFDADPSETGIGLLTAKTGPDGRFAFAGLRLGRFSIEARDLRLRGVGPLRVPAVTGDADVRLVVDWHFVHVRILGDGGTPVEHASITVAGWAREHRDRFDAAVASGSGADDFFDEADFGISMRGPGETSLYAPRGGFLYVRGKPFTGDASEGVLIADAGFEVPTDSNESTLDLVPKLSEAVGRVRLSIRDASGRTISDYKATLEGKGGLNYAFIRRSPDEEGRLPAVLAGPYRLEVEPGEYLVEHFLPIETDVVVEAGREIVVPLLAVPGGRLNLTVAVPGLGEDDYSIGAKVALLTESGEPIENVRGFFRLEGGGDSWSTGIRPNQPTFAGRVLAPGRYRVHVEARGFEPAEAAFVAEPGRAADVTIELERVK